MERLDYKQERKKQILRGLWVVVAGLLNLYFLRLGIVKGEAFIIIVASIGVVATFAGLLLTHQLLGLLDEMEELDKRLETLNGKAKSILDKLK